MRQQILAVLGLAAIAVGSVQLTGCGSTTYAVVRAVHGSSTAPNVDMKADGTTVASNLAFGNASSYTKVPIATTATYNFYAAGSDNTAVLTTTGPLAKDSVVTVFALGELTHATAVAKVEDPTNDAAVPANNNAKLRAVHGSYLAGPVDIYVTAPNTVLGKSNTPTISGFTFGTVSPYLQVPAGTYQVQITATGTQNVLINVPSVTLSAGQLYTAIAVDPTSAPNSAPSVVLINDPVPPTPPFN